MTPRERRHMRLMLDVLTLRAMAAHATVRLIEADPSLPPSVIQRMCAQVRTEARRVEADLASLQAAWRQACPGPLHRFRRWWRRLIGTAAAPVGLPADRAGQGHDTPRAAAPYLRLVGGTAAAGAGTHNPSSGPTGPEVA